MLRLVVVGWLVSQRGVQPDVVVEAHDVVRDVRLGLGGFTKSRSQTRSSFKLGKNFSITALSQQLPLQLMLHIKPWRCSNPMCSSLAYRLPLSE